MSPATKKVEDFNYLQNYGAIRGKGRQPYLLVRLDGHRTSSLNPFNQQPQPKLPIFAAIGARASRPHGLCMRSPKLFAPRPVALSWVFTPLRIGSHLCKPRKFEGLRNGLAQEWRTCWQQSCLIVRDLLSKLQTNGGSYKAGTGLAPTRLKKMASNWLQNCQK
jgi:hypothetical protein